MSSKDGQGEKGAEGAGGEASEDMPQVPPRRNPFRQEIQAIDREAPAGRDNGPWNPLWPSPRSVRRPKTPAPTYFERVANHLGYRPPGELPRAPQPIPPEVEMPGERPPDFWDPSKDGGFDDSNPKRGFPDFRELGVQQLPEEMWRKPETGRWLEPGPSHGYTADFCAYYLPWHLGGDEHWGIYFRVPHMKIYIERVEREFGRGNMTELVTEQVFWHEMEHFEQELAATALEDLTGQILYPQWLAERYTISVRLTDKTLGPPEEVRLVDEALATAREVEWARGLEQTQGWPTGFAEYVEWDSRRKPTGYNRFYLCLEDAPKQRARAAFLDAVRSVAGLSPNGYPDPETAERLFGTPTWSHDEVPVYHVWH